MSYNPSFTQLVRVFSSIIHWTEDEIKGVTDRLEVKRHKKGTKLLREGEVCPGAWFINSGFCRGVIRYENEEEKTQHFAGENDFTTGIDGLLFDQPSSGAIYVMENSEIVFIPKTTIEWICENVREGNKLVRVLHEYHAVLKLKDIFSMYIPDPMKRYEQLIARFSDIELRSSQKVIASYLNISAAHFSRLKRQYLRRNG